MEEGISDLSSRLESIWKLNYEMRNFVMSYWDLQYQELIKDVQSLVDQLRNLDEDRRLNNEYRCVIDFSMVVFGTNSCLQFMIRFDKGLRT